jgi:hypothetical protein
MVIRSAFSDVEISDEPLTGFGLGVPVSSATGRR